MSDKPPPKTSQPPEGGGGPFGFGFLGGTALGGGIGWWGGYSKGKKDGYKEGFNAGISQGFANGQAKALDDLGKRYAEKHGVLAKIGIIRFEKTETSAKSIRLNYNAGAIPPDVHELFRETVNAYISDLPRASCLMAAVTVEHALRLKYEQIESKQHNGNLVDLIEWAKSKGLLPKADATFAHGLRQMGNLYKHEKTSVGSVDPQLAVSVSFKVVTRVFGV